MSQSLEVYEAALTPRPRRAWIVLCVLIGCATIGWLGACVVGCMQAYKDARAIEACAGAGLSWTGNQCIAPEVHVTVENPMLGPGGA